MSKTTRKRVVSSQIGAVSVLEVLRSLRLARLVNEACDSACSVAYESLTPRAKSATTGGLVESLVLGQIVCGGDLSAGMTLLANDDVIKHLRIDFPSPATINAFCTWLANQPWESKSKAGLRKVLRGLVAAVWDVWERPWPKKVTIELVVLPQRGDPPHVEWSVPLTDQLPALVFCVWREANLVLAGGMVRNCDEIRSIISAAWHAVPAGRLGRLFRAGRLCSDESILGFLSAQPIPFTVNLPDGPIQRSSPVGFMVSLHPDRIPHQSLPPSAWHSYQNALVPDLHYAWLGSKEELNPLQGIALGCLLLRAGTAQSRDPICAAFATNKWSVPRALIDHFLRGRREVNQALLDMMLLTSSASADLLYDRAAEGRLLLACLAHNVCTAIRATCFPEDRHMPLSRIRSSFIQVLGQKLSERTSGYFRVSEPAAAALYQKIQAKFRTHEIPTFRF